MKTRWWTLLTVVAVSCGVLSSAGCGNKEQKNGHAQTKISLRLKWIHQGQFAGFYCAARRGFFRRENIEAQIKAGGQDFNAVKLVAAGVDDFGVWGADQLIIAREKGIPIVALAVIYPQSPACFTALKKSGINSPRDFVGRRIGMQYGTDLETVYLMMLKKVGIRRDQIREVPVQFNFQMLLEGQVDAWPSYAINEPILAAEKGIEVNVTKPADYGVRMYADTLFTSEAMVQKNPDLVRRVVKAVVGGWEYAIAHPVDAVQDLRAYEPGIDAAHQLRMVKAAIPFIRLTADHQIGSMSMTVWREIEMALRQQGLLSGTVDLTKLVDSTFVDEINKNRGEVR